MDKALPREPDLKTDTKSDLVETSKILAQLPGSLFQFCDNGHESQTVCLGQSLVAFSSKVTGDGKHDAGSVCLLSQSSIL